jgi:voltage-gated potassium channel
MGHYRLSALVLVPMLLVVVGTLGYWFIEEEYTLFDALYMTVITLTTVGYAEVHPLSTGGRWFTMMLLLGGVFVLFYTGTEIVRVVISGEVQQLFGRGIMERSLAALSNHVIVCGYGRMGRIVCHDFSRQGRAFVIIDRGAELLKDFAMTGGLAVVGDATSDEVLKRAGVHRAQALVTVVPSDADNLYITMSARLLNARLFIVARAEGEGAEQKLVRAGADRVVAPFALGGSRVVQAVIRPTVLEFIELATRTEHLELQIEQTEVAAGSQLAGATLTTSRLRPDLGLIIVAIKKRDGSMIYTPSPETRMEVGDTLVALGRRSQLDQLETLARAR